MTNDMRNKKRFLWPASCLMLALCLAACQDDDAENGMEEPPVPLTLEVKAGAVKNTSAGVQVIPSTEEGKYYVHLFTDAEYQAVKGNLMEEMTSLAASHEDEVVQGGKTYLFDELQASTSYVACAAPVEPETESDVKQVAFTTLNKTWEKVPAKWAFMTDYANSEMKGNNEFALKLSEAELVDNMWDIGKLLNLYGIRPLVEGLMPEDPAFFNGVYKVDETKNTWTMHNNSCSLQTWKDREMQGSSEYLETGEFVVVTDSDGVCRVSGFFTANGKEYEIEYTGDVSYQLSGYYGYKGYEPQLEEDMVDLDYTLMKESVYCATKDGVGHYSLACVHDPDPDDSAGGYNKNCLRLNLYAPVDKYPLLELPSGTYVIDEEAAPFTPFIAIPGDYVRESAYTFVNAGCFYYKLDNVTGIQILGVMRQGTITVSREGTEYTIEIDATTNLGHKVTGTYKGSFEIGVEGF